MDARDRQAIEEIFRRLEDVERQGATRDPEAEGLIQERIRQRPAYAYYLAQTVVAQQQALEAAQDRLDAAEGRGRQLQREEGGFLSRIFGGGSGGERPRTSVPASPAYDPRTDPRYDPRYAGRRPGFGGGGFLAGAAQTAMGVAGGVVLGNMLMGAFSGGDEAQAAEADTAADTSADTAAEDAGGFDDGGDFEF